MTSKQTHTLKRSNKEIRAKNRSSAKHMAQHYHLCNSNQDVYLATPFQLKLTVTATITRKCPSTIYEIARQQNMSRQNWTQKWSPNDLPDLPKLKPVQSPKKLLKHKQLKWQTTLYSETPVPCIDSYNFSLQYTIIDHQVSYKIASKLL